MAKMTQFGMGAGTTATGAAGEGKRLRFRVAGYLFTYRKATGATRVRIEMWREDPTSGERYWITVAACAPNRAAARSVALALVAWVKSCDIGPKRDVKSLAVAESFAMLRQHLAFTNPGASGSVRGRRESVGSTPASMSNVRVPRTLPANDGAAITLPGACGGTRVFAA